MNPRIRPTDVFHDRPQYRNPTITTRNHERTIPQPPDTRNQTPDTTPMPDSTTQAPDTDYFFLGDGKVMATVQWSRNAEMSPLGLSLVDPERMSRKNGSLLFHPELGLSRTMLVVLVDGVRYRPTHDGLHVAWHLERKPAVVARWRAGEIEVTERFSVQPASSNVHRDVSISNGDGHLVEFELPFYANPLVFDEFGAHPSSVLYALGYTSLTLYSVPTGRVFERFLRVPAGSSGSGYAASFIYSIEAVGTHEIALYPHEFSFPPAEVQAPSSPLGESFQSVIGSVDVPPSLPARIEEMYRVSKVSLRATVSQLGKFDASIWQYDHEWAMDAAMVAAAAVTSGLFDLGRQVLTNILTRLTSPEGIAAEAGRVRGGEMAELNANGAILDALWHYWRWTGDESLLRLHWKRITAIAEYPLRDEFRHESGLLVGRRDFWERFPWMGVGRGFELGHQLYCAVGLPRAAEIAEAFGYIESATRWREAGARIREAMIYHPTFSLIEDGVFIHRRLEDGSVQRTMAADNEWSDPDYASYLPSEKSEPIERACEPDITEILPVVYGLVDPAGEIATRTLENVRSLWSPTGSGGYARYNIDSDPDSPGAWPFATAFVAAAEIEAGMTERASETITWLLDAAGAGGSWLEFYGERPTPPFPPVGIIVWGWAQYLLLVTKHIVGVRVSGDAVTITPKLLGIEHTVRVGAHLLHIAVRGFASATIDGVEARAENGTVRLELPLAKDHVVMFGE